MELANDKVRQIVVSETMTGIIVLTARGLLWFRSCDKASGAWGEWTAAMLPPGCVEWTLGDKGPE